GKFLLHCQVFPDNLTLEPYVDLQCQHPYLMLKFQRVQTHLKKNRQHRNDYKLLKPHLVAAASYLSDMEGA
ncbi:hypothetical protein FRX31_032657, partial [Thalictrum thalictroides]